MGFVSLDDREQIESVLRKDVYANLYGLGDLDDFFFPRTTWYAWEEAGRLAEIALLYQAADQPILLAFAQEQARMHKLLRELTLYLPGRFYAHLSPGLEAVFADGYDLEGYGRHYKMALVEPLAVGAVETGGVEALGPKDLPDLLEFYAESYPENCFDARMLALGGYFGIRLGSELVSVAGLHVFSTRYRVAALGNIATHPDYRGRGYGRMVTACLCQQLLENVDHIGLNVKIDNQPALRCYRGLGFETCTTYREFMIKKQA